MELGEALSHANAGSSPLAYLEYHNLVDAKGRYLHYDQIRRRIPSGMNLDAAWSLVKDARLRNPSSLLFMGDSNDLGHYNLTPTIHRTMSEVDRHTTNASLEYMSSKIGEERHFQYLINDLIEDEAISSSQLEGAATTTLVAKDMLKRNRKPRTQDERMIIGNFKMMKFAWDNRDRPLSIDLILEMHEVGTEGIDDAEYTPGAFRTTDDIAVVDADGEQVHVPPLASGIKRRLERISVWANMLHDGEDGNEYIHPLIKAIALHFSIGFEHPFRDGNGRVARSLFYWFMFKNGYGAFRYIAISKLLKAAPVKYGKSYLYTETDSMDMTYFIEHQCSTILRAIDGFKKAYRKSLNDIETFNAWLWESGLISKLSEKQKVIFQVAKSGVAKLFTISNVAENLDCSYNTAATALNGLVQMRIFRKRKNGREWIYSMLERQEIKENWSQ